MRRSGGDRLNGRSIQRVSLDVAINNDLGNARLWAMDAGGHADTDVVGGNNQAAPRTPELSPCLFCKNGVVQTSEKTNRLSISGTTL